MAIGPVQIVILGFPEAGALDDLAVEVAALTATPGVRLLDVISVSKDDDGRITILEVDTGNGGEADGSLKALTGLTGDEAADVEPELEEAGFTADEVWFVDDVIPPGTSATLALIEHTWAIPLRDHIREAGGVLLADAWVHPSDLASAGVVSQEHADTHLLF